jgi:hypothetical protein
MTDFPDIPLHKPPPPINDPDAAGAAMLEIERRANARAAAVGLPDLGVFDDVMVDIETMSLHPHNALILSIGMLRFDPRGPELKIGPKMLLVLDVYEQLLLGREVDPSTQAWWASQPAGAAAHWMDTNRRVTVQEAAEAITINLSDAKRVWANGIQFDLSNIVSLCKSADYETPWNYRAPRDMRTFCEETPAVRGIDIGEGLDFNEKHKIIPHHPVSDCMVQAYRVWSHYK